MNKEVINFVKKELKKNKEVTIIHEPTEKELQYLNSIGINVEEVTVMHQGLFIDDKYPMTMFKYSLN